MSYSAFVFVDSEEEGVFCFALFRTPNKTIMYPKMVRKGARVILLKLNNSSSLNSSGFSVPPPDIRMKPRVITIHPNTISK